MKGEMYGKRKKASRFGVRLSAILIAVLLVVCMAVPAFAVSTGAYPDTLPAVPDNSRQWCLVEYVSGSYGLIDVTSVSQFKYRTFAAQTNGFYALDGSGAYVSCDQYKLSDGTWVFSEKDSCLFGGLMGQYEDMDTIIWSSKAVSFDSSLKLFLLSGGEEYPVYPLNDIPSGYGYLYSHTAGSNFYYVIRFSDPASVYAFVDDNGVIKLKSNGTMEWRWYAGKLTSWAEKDELSANEIVYSSFKIPFNNGGMLYPPYDPPIKQIGGVLTVVLDWVGSVVSAVVSGPMSGLLVLLAVPVAITLLLVAFIVIRRIIWGA